MFPKIRGTPKSGFSIIFTIHFGFFPPYFWKHPFGNQPIFIIHHQPRSYISQVHCLACIQCWRRCHIYTHIYIYIYVGVNPKIGGKKPTWMVKIMENPDLGVPLIFGNTHICIPTPQQKTHHQETTGYVYGIITPPKINSSTLKNDAWKTAFLLGMPFLAGAK